MFKGNGLYREKRQKFGKKCSIPGKSEKFLALLRDGVAIHEMIDLFVACIEIILNGNLFILN